MIAMSMNSINKWRTNFALEISKNILALWAIKKLKTYSKNLKRWNRLIVILVLSKDPKLLNKLHMVKKVSKWEWVFPLKWTAHITYHESNHLQLPFTLIKTKTETQEYRYHFSIHGKIRLNRANLVMNLFQSTSISLKHL